MSSSTPAQPKGPRPIRRPISGQEDSTRPGDDQILSKLHSVAIQAALSVLLSVFGLGSAIAQSIDQDMTLGANTQATRDRVISEIRQARADGTIRRWSPVFVELRPEASLKGSRFAPFGTHQGEVDKPRLVPRDDGNRSPGIASLAQRAAQ